MPSKSNQNAKNYSLETAAGNLKNFTFFLQPFVVTDDLENEYFDYLKDLRTKLDTQEISETEEAYYWSRWLRNQAMLRHLDQFDRLIELCGTFVDEITKIGKQSILAIRGGLTKAPVHQRPSRKVEFKRELLPDRPPLSVSEYETLLGGPHVFGARLLWWCAAAKNPNKFGYPDGFSLQMWMQPFWFIEDFGKKRKLKLNQRPMILLQEAVKYCLENQESSELELPREDGPGPGGSFYWKGRQISLQLQQVKLVTSLWKRRDKWRDIRDVIDEAWSDTPNNPKGAVGTCASRANKLFVDEGVPFTIVINNDKVRIESHPEN